MNKSRKIVSCIFLLFVILVSLLFSHFTSVKITEGLVGDSCTETSDCVGENEKCNDDTNKCVSSSPEASNKTSSSTDASDDEIATLKKDKNKLNNPQQRKKQNTE